MVLIPLAYAETPLPAKKPNQTNAAVKSDANFLNILDEAAQIPSPPSIQSSVKLHSIITPPPLPEQKKTTPLISENVTMADGIPLPNRKPLHIKMELSTPTQTLQLPSQSNQQSQTLYRGNDDDRTANQKNISRNNSIERSPARKREVFRETTEKSPFKTAKLPRARETSTRDPIIVFFKEQSSDLEVGQIDIIKSDILTPLKRSSSRKVAVYGYAEKDSSNPDKANQLSLSRALLISEYLVDSGVNPNRIEARSMASDTPITPKNRVDVIIF